MVLPFVFPSEETQAYVDVDLYLKISVFDRLVIFLFNVHLSFCVFPSFRLCQYGFGFCCVTSGCDVDKVYLVREKWRNKERKNEIWILIYYIFHNFWCICLICLITCLFNIGYSLYIYSEFICAFYCIDLALPELKNVNNLFGLPGNGGNITKWKFWPSALCYCSVVVPNPNCTKIHSGEESVWALFIVGVCCINLKNSLFDWREKGRNFQNGKGSLVFDVISVFFIHGDGCYRLMKWIKIERVWNFTINIWFSHHHQLNLQTQGHAEQSSTWCMKHLNSVGTKSLTRTLKGLNQCQTAKL